MLRSRGYSRAPIMEITRCGRATFYRAGSRTQGTLPTPRSRQGNDNRLRYEEPMMAVAHCSMTSRRCSNRSERW